MSEQNNLKQQALLLAAESTANALAIEEENEKLKVEIKENLKAIEEFELSCPKAEELKRQCREKEELVEQKRKDLVELQSAIIKAYTNQKNNVNAPQPSLNSIPIVMNRIQKYITDITDAAVTQKTISISIIALYKLAESLKQLYDNLADEKVKIINETPEEKEERIRQYAKSQTDILAQLKANLPNQQNTQPKPSPMFTNPPDDAPPPPARFVQRPPTPMPNDVNPGLEIPDENKQETDSQ